MRYKVSLYIDEELSDALKRAAHEIHESQSFVLRDLMRRHLLPQYAPPPSNGTHDQPEPTITPPPVTV